MAINISSNYYSGYANRRASANASMFNEWRSSMKETTSSTGGVYDYKAAQKETAAMIEQYKEQSNASTALRKDSAEFLKTYTQQMKTMDTSSSALQGANLDKMIGEISADGKISDANLKKVTESVESMVKDYNTTLKTLNDNAGRGSGVMRQIGRMAGAPAAETSMEMVGVSVTKDGSLKLDTEKLKSALTTAAASDAKTGTTNQMDFVKGIIGGNSGIASGVQSDAKLGQSISANSLISNDLAKLQSQAFSNSFSMEGMYNRGGSYNMMNMGTIGLLMNVMA